MRWHTINTFCFGQNKVISVNMYSLCFSWTDLFSTTVAARKVCYEQMQFATAYNIWLVIHCTWIIHVYLLCNILASQVRLPWCRSGKRPYGFLLKDISVFCILSNVNFAIHSFFHLISYDEQASCLIDWFLCRVNLIKLFHRNISDFWLVRPTSYTTQVTVYIYK